MHTVCVRFPSRVLLPPRSCWPGSVTVSPRLWNLFVSLRWPQKKSKPPQFACRWNLAPSFLLPDETLSRNRDTACSFPTLTVQNQHKSTQTVRHNEYGWMCCEMHQVTVFCCISLSKKNLFKKSRQILSGSNISCGWSAFYFQLINEWLFLLEP